MTKTEDIIAALDDGSLCAAGLKKRNRTFRSGELNREVSRLGDVKSAEADGDCVMLR
jgi:hypothetical protein